jgi:hypothetical protein
MKHASNAVRGKRPELYGVIRMMNQGNHMRFFARAYERADDIISKRAPKNLSLFLALILVVSITILHWDFSQSNAVEVSINHGQKLPVDLTLLNNSQFKTYTYGGYPVQKPDSTHLIFLFPNRTQEGQLSGSDAVTLNSYVIQKVDFDAVFNTPKINAPGFDEMAVFAASNTVTYKGTEFGIRLSLKDGFIYGYIQEPNGSQDHVKFLMLKLTLNDGITHHYTLTRLGPKISFSINGVTYGYLTYSSRNSYANLTFSVNAVVHRVTHDWTSNGDNMTAGNFAFN